jgi:hypothetical protein
MTCYHNIAKSKTFHGYVGTGSGYVWHIYRNGNRAWFARTVNRPNCNVACTASTLRGIVAQLDNYGSN